MPDVTNQPAELATSSRPEIGFGIVIVDRRVVRGGRFMLTKPEPATPLPEDVADARMLRAALAQGRIPYNEVRRELGLK